MKGEVVAVAAAETGGAPIEVDVVTKIDRDCWGPACSPTGWC